MTKNVEKVKVHNAFFPSVFSGKTSLQKSQTLEIMGKVQGKVYLPSVEENQVKEYLNKLDRLDWSVSHDGMYPRVLRELADVLARLLLIIFE